jgi:hypothetical protein
MTAFDTNAPLDVMLKEFRKIIQERLAADSRLTPMQEYSMGRFIPEHVSERLDEELLPLVEEILDSYDIDPTPDYTDGEPPLSSDERWRASHQEHLRLHS